MSTDKEKYRRKIRKLLALAESSNPHEAARAKEQAMAMMRIHGIADGEVEVIDQPSITLPYKSLKSSDAILISAVVHAAGVEVYLRGRYEARRWKARVHIIGFQKSAELADYALDVLHRQMRTATAELKRKSPYLGERELEEFRRGYATSAGRKLINLFGERAIPDAVKARFTADCADAKAADIRKPKGARAGATDALQAAGYQSGLTAELNPAATHDSAPVALIGKEGRAA